MSGLVSPCCDQCEFVSRVYTEGSNAYYARLLSNVSVGVEEPGGIRTATCGRMAIQLSEDDTWSGLCLFRASVGEDRADGVYFGMLRAAE